tara:strand:- start:1781 stop:2107 length:327 start_codon:yes stop_codon:yes gene_type:complete
MKTPTVRLKLSDVFKSFQIDLRAFYKNRVYVQHHLHIQPSEIDDLCYYEYQWMMKDLVEMLKEQNGDKSSSQESANEQMETMKSNASKYNKGIGGNMPKLGSMKMPKM